MFMRLLFLALHLPLLNCANILALIPSISYSHQVAFIPIWKELSLRGHNVTVLTPHPQRDPKLVNLTELSMDWTDQFSQNASQFLERELSPLTFHSIAWKIMDNFCEMVLTSKEGQNLLHNHNHFDLVMAESVCPEFLAFAELYDCPKILFSTMSLTAVMHDLLGDFTHPVLHPEYVTPFHGQLSFKERVMSTLVYWYLYYMHVTSYFPRREKLLRQYFNSTTTLAELIGGIDLLFLGTNTHIHGARPFLPATITIGGYRKDMSLRPMAPDIKKFLDDAKEGCILVSLGSNLKSSQLSLQLQRTLIEALSDLPYEVLWKYEDESFKMPKNIKTAKWLPQQKVLNHPNVRVFVYQGGLQSMEEAIYGEVPFVVLPFISDQFQNARILQNKDIAIVLDRNNLDKKDLQDAVIEVMTNPKYLKGVKKLKQLILDEPLTGTEKAIWWTEYILRHKGAKHLKNPAADIPFYQYYLLDVIGFLLTSIILSVAIPVLMLKKFWRCVVKNSNKKEKCQ